MESFFDALPAYTASLDGNECSNININISSVEVEAAQLAEANLLLPSG